MAASTGESAQAPDGFRLLEEGSAKIIFNEQNEVFYNNVQVFNRDLSILVIKLFLEQRQAEITDQTARKEAGVSWRRIAPTWNHWFGSAPTPAAETAASEVKLDQRTGQVPLDEVYTRAAPNFHADPATDWAARLQETRDENGAHILEALSATGLRSIRYFQEIPGIRRLIVNDLEPAAVESIKRNIDFNGLDTARCVANQGDANMVMHNARAAGRSFDVIDLDPYGSAAPFLDAAVQSICNGGLLCVTCTDLAVLCGNQMDVCYSKYGSIPVKARYCHDMAVRIILASIDRIASRYKRYIVPLFGARIDFYARVFVRVYESAAEMKKTPTKVSMVAQCVGCDAFYLRPVGLIRGNKCVAGRGLPSSVGCQCQDCGGNFAIAGPIWNRPLINRAFCREILHKLPSNKSVLSDCPHLTTVARIRGEVGKALQEIPTAPLFYSVASLCNRLRCTCPPVHSLLAAVRSTGFAASQAAADTDSLKTNAPPSVVWDVMRHWVRRHPISKKRQGETKSVGYRILQKEPTVECDFVRGAAAIKRKRSEFKSHFVRYQQNPESHWGPKSRASGAKRQKTHESSPQQPVNAAAKSHE